MVPLPDTPPADDRKAAESTRETTPVTGSTTTTSWPATLADTGSPLKVSGPAMVVVDAGLPMSVAAVPVAFRLIGPTAVRPPDSVAGPVTPRAPPTDTSPVKLVLPLASTAPAVTGTKAPVLAPAKAPLVMTVPASGSKRQIELSAVTKRISPGVSGSRTSAPAVIAAASAVLRSVTSWVSWLACSTGGRAKLTPPVSMVWFRSLTATTSSPLPLPPDDSTMAQEVLKTRSGPAETTASRMAPLLLPAMRSGKLVAEP